MDNILQAKYINADGKIYNCVTGNSYRLNLTTTRNFFTHFVKSIEENSPNRLVLAEKWRNFETLPVVFFLDFAFASQDADNISNYMSFVYITRSIVSVLKKLQDDEVIELVEEQFMGHMEDNIGENFLKCLLTMSDGFISADRLYHVYLRVHFPFMRIVQEKALRFYERVYSSIIQDLDQGEYMRYFNDLDSGTWREIVVNPLLVNSEVIPMFGTNITQENFQERFIDIVNYDDEWDTEQSIVNFEQFFALDGVRFHPQEITNLYNRKCASFYPDKSNNIQQIVPLMLDLAYGADGNYTFDYNEVGDDQEMDANLFITRDIMWDSLIGNNIRLLRIFLGIISASYWQESITNWILLGNIIYRTYFDANLVDEGLQLWKEITREKTHFNPDCCQNFYGSGSMNYTVKTLGWIANETNREDYLNSIYKWQDELMDEMSKQPNLERNAAELFYSLRWTNLISIQKGNRKKNIWKIFNNGRWNTYNEDTLANNFSKSLQSLLEKYSYDLQIHRRQQGLEKSEKDGRDYLGNYMRNLQNRTWVGKCLRWLSGWTFTSKFNQYKNSQENILGFGERYLEIINSSVYERLNQKEDSKKNSVFSRPGRPEDFVTKYSDVKLKDYTWHNQEVKEIMNWMYMMFPDEELKNYVLKILARCLCSEGNADRIFPIFVSGGNLDNRGSEGKTTLKNLIDSVFGKYSFTPDSNVLSANTRKNSTANPSLTKAEGCKILWINEISGYAILDEGLIKQLTGGNEKVYMRKLHENGGSQTIFYIPIMVCNGIPEFKNLDSAMKNRVKTIPFFTRYTDDAPDDIAEQWKTRCFKIDKTFKDRIRRLSSAMLWILTQYYTLYFTEGLNTPQIVKEFSESVWASRDIYLRFIRDNYEITKYNADILDKNDVHEDFRIWLNQNNISYRNFHNMAQNLIDKLSHLGVNLCGGTQYGRIRRKPV